MITLDKVMSNTDQKLSIDISDFQLLPYGIFYLNLNRQITFWNKACEVLTGYNYNDIKYLHCYDLNICQNKDQEKGDCQANCPVLKSFNENLFVNTTFSMKRMDGNDLQVCGYITPVKNDIGYINGAIVFLNKDIGYDRIYELNKELIRNKEMRHELLTVVSHDLRTPIAALLCYFSVFFSDSADNLTCKQVVVLNSMKRICLSMLKMLNSILDVTAIESGKLTLNKTKVNIKEILSLNAINPKSMADQKNIDIKIEIDPDLPEIYLDKDKFHQLIDNLIGNAIKFSHPNTSIKIAVFREKKDMVFIIKDQGQGIPQDELRYIFEPFNTSSIKPTAKEFSNGIGLFIVKKIVELHNGSIEVESKLNEGTLFKIRLPF